MEPNPRYDPRKARRAQRHGADRGVRIYVPAAELERAGYPLNEPLTYRVWGSDRGGVTVRFYREGQTE